MSTPCQSLEDRAVGCLYGQAIGDALGTRYEFETFDRVKKMLEKDIDKKTGFLPILGGGPFNLIAGQVTDDTELAMGLARSLLKQGTFVKEDIAANYLTWASSRPFDIGSTTRSALWSQSLQTVPPPSPSRIYATIVHNARAFNTESLSNGCLMRISPLAIAASSCATSADGEACDWSDDDLKTSVGLDTALTNPNPIAVDAVLVYVTAVRALIRTADRQEAFRLATLVASTSVVQNLLAAAAEKAIPVELHSTSSYISSEPRSPVFTNGDRTCIGYLGVALQGAFYELLHCESFESGLVNTIRRGGDTDTNGCITGALLGALFGASVIPEQWKSTVVDAKPKRLKKYPAVDLSDLESVALRLLKCKKPTSGLN